MQSAVLLEAPVVSLKTVSIPAMSPGQEITAGRHMSEALQDCAEATAERAPFRIVIIQGMYPEATVTPAAYPVV